MAKSKDEEYYDKTLEMMQNDNPDLVEGAPYDPEVDPYYVKLGDKDVEEAKKIRRGRWMVPLAVGSFLVGTIAKPLYDWLNPKKPVIKTEKTIWFDKSNDGNGTFLDVSNPLETTPLNLIDTPEDFGLFTAGKPDITAFYNRITTTGNGLDMGNSTYKIDDKGNVKVIIAEKGLNDFGAHNSKNTTVAFDQFQEEVAPKLFGVDDVTVRVYEFMTKENPVTTEFSSDRIVDGVGGLFEGENIDGANYTLKTKAEFNYTTGQVSYIVDFVAKDDSGRSDITKTVDHAKFKEVYDILIDGYADGDQTNEIDAWLINQFTQMQDEQRIIDLQQTIIDLTDYYTDLIDTIYGQWNASNASHDAVVNSLTNQLNNVTYYTGVDFQNITLINLQENLTRTVEIDTPDLFLAVYNELPEEYRKYLLQNDSHVQTLFNGLADDSEFAKYTLYIPGTLAENATGTVNVTGDEDQVYDTPRASADVIAGLVDYCKGKLNATQWKYGGFDDMDDTLDFIADPVDGALAQYDQLHNTSLLKEFLSPSDFTKYTDSNETNGELESIDYERALTPNIHGKIIYTFTDGTKVEGWKSPELLEVLDGLIG